MKKAERLAKAKRELDNVLNRSGFNRIKAKYGKAKAIEFPDYKADLTNYESLGNGFGKPTPKKQLHPDAKQFPVGNSHKQGLELIYSKEYVSQMNGKKT